MPFPNQKNEINSCEIHMRQYHYFHVELVFHWLQKEFAGLSANANEIFWVTNNGADMPVRVGGKYRITHNHFNCSWRTR